MGVRPFITWGTLAWIHFVARPKLFPANPYVGLMVATVIYSIGGGLFELLLSAIVQAIPNDSKEKAMSLLHSFYAWGFIVVVVGTTLMIKVLGRSNWPILVLIWSVFPLINFFNFLRVPLAPAISEEKRTKIRELLSSRYFLFVILGIAVGGATEVSMSQWTSAFVEASLGLPKEVGDLLGLCLFALLLGSIRAVYGSWGDKFPLYKAMLFGSVLCIACYLIAAFSPLPVISLVACILQARQRSLVAGSVVNGANRFSLCKLFSLCLSCRRR